MGDSLSLLTPPRLKTPLTMPGVSKYVLYVSNVSGATRTKDIQYEFEQMAGGVFDIVRDHKSRGCLVEMDRADDAEYAYRKMDRFKMDGREWRVYYATPDDFKFFGVKWTEGSPEAPSKKSRSRSPPKSARSDSATSTKH